MTAITTISIRMRPRSRLGWWSVGLAGLVLFVAPIASVATGLAIRLFESSYVVATSDAVFLTVPCVVVSSALGVAAILLRRDYSPVVVLVTAVMTTTTACLWADEFLLRV